MRTCKHIKGIDVTHIFDNKGLLKSFVIPYTSLLMSYEMKEMCNSRFPDHDKYYKIALNRAKYLNAKSFNNKSYTRGIKFAIDPLITDRENTVTTTIDIIKVIIN